MILAFDTSGPRVSVAFLAGDDVYVDVQDMARGQAEALIPQIEAILAEAGAGWADVTAIGVGVGPGNFTGIRISVSAARGMALGLGVPAIGVSTFDAVRACADDAKPVTVPAPRDQVYLSKSDGSAPELVAADTDRDARSAADFAPSDLILAMARVAEQRLAAGEATVAKPLYVKRPDAAPARDTPPTIIDA